MWRIGRAAMVGTGLAVALGVLFMVTGAGSGRANESRLATVDVITLLQEMLRTPEYFDPREESKTRSEGELKQLENEVRRLDGELRLVTPEERARGQQLYNDLQAKQRQYQQLAEQRVREFQSLSGEQAAEAYARIHAAATRVGMREGYTHVLMSRPGAALEETDTITMVTQGILARPVLMFPEADDLTDRVRQELGYEVVPADSSDDGGADPADSGSGEGG